MTSAVRVNRQGPIATVTLNRPDKHNAVNLEMFAALIDAGAELAADASIRAIVLDGDGESFCAGIDLSVMQADGLAELAAKMQPEEGSPANFFQRAAYVWREVPQPVICALHGAAFGAGFQIAMGADLRYARPDCRLAVMEIKWGIIPDMAISKTLAGVLPVDKLKELAQKNLSPSSPKSRPPREVIASPEAVPRSEAPSEMAGEETELAPEAKPPQEAEPGQEAGPARGFGGQYT